MEPKSKIGGASSLRIAIFVSKFWGALHNRLYIRKNSQVLDIGCGCGGEVALIKKITGANVIGIDKSWHMLSKTASSRQFVRADCFNLPFIPSSFDCIYSINLLQLLITRDRFFKEAHRILVDKGRLGLPVPTPEQILNRFVNSFFPSLASIEYDRYPSLDIVIAEMKNFGFRNIDTDELFIGETVVDRYYLSRLKAGVLSGLLFLPQNEKQKGLKKLENSILKWEVQGRLPRLVRKRTIIVGMK